MQAKETQFTDLEQQLGQLLSDVLEQAELIERGEKANGMRRQTTLACGYVIEGFRAC